MSTTLDRVSIHRRFTKDIAEDLSCSRSVLHINPTNYYSISISSIVSTLRLVRVLDVYDIYFNDFPMEILKLANLRFLAIKCRGNLPSAVWRLRNLQTLLVCLISFDEVILPYEAWAISGLRHIKIMGNAIDITFEIPHIHETLRTISGVRLHGLLASNLLNNIPNIKKLEISGHGFVSEHEIVDLSHLHKLETLKVNDFRASFLSLVKLPNSLKKLSLEWCTLPKGLMNGVGGLQLFEVLKVKGC